MIIVQNLLGITLLLAIAFLLSNDRKKVSPKLILTALGIQFVIALLFLNLPFLSEIFSSLNSVVTTLSAATNKATNFMFGYLAGGKTPFAITNPDSNFIVAFQVLPMIMVVSAISSVLYCWGVLPFIIDKSAKAINRIIPTNSALSFGAAASIFFGTIEAPLLIKKHLGAMDRSDLFAMITCSMATVAGTVMILYSAVLSKVVPDAIGHIITASIISIPAALMVAKIMIPGPQTISDSSPIKIDKESSSTIEAIISGTMDGLDMVLKIVAIIIVLFTFVYLIDQGLAAIPVEGFPQSLTALLGYLFRPLMWLLGLNWAESQVAGEIFSAKVVLNEFVAYLNISQLEEGTLSKHSTIVLTYALCGFANLASAGIITGGLSALLPARRSEIARSCMLSLISGNFATLLTGMIVSIVLWTFGS